MTAQAKITPRGLNTLLPNGGLPEVLSPYLIKLVEKTGGVTGPIGRQFIASPQKETQFWQKGSQDPLCEDQFEVAPGLIYKYRGQIDSQDNLLYGGRALWTITRLCAAYCRFCTRGREVGLPPSHSLKKGGTLARRAFLTAQDIKQVFAYLSSHPELNEIILSGGDPLASPRPYLEKIITGLVRLQKKGRLSLIRIGTRLPISNPLLLKDWHYRLLAKINNPYLMIHLNHPAELTPETLKVISRFRQQSQALVMSQTVLLRGVNDSIPVLYQLFSKSAAAGIHPYYLFQCDPVSWAPHFLVPIKKALQIWGQLRPRLSGVAATAKFVIDTPFGFGKIPLPEGNAWKVDYRYFYDFHQKKHRL